MSMIVFIHANPDWKSDQKTMSQSSWLGRTLSGRYPTDALLGRDWMLTVDKATNPNHSVIAESSKCVSLP